MIAQQAWLLVKHVQAVIGTLHVKKESLPESGLAFGGVSCHSSFTINVMFHQNLVRQYKEKVPTAD